jgi:hypothetical protein
MMSLRYKLRSKVEISDVSEDFHVWTRFGSSSKTAAPEGEKMPDCHVALKDDLAAELYFCRGGRSLLI